MNNLKTKGGDRKIFKTGKYFSVEDALYTWFLHQQRRHTLISWEMIREKAKRNKMKLLENVSLMPVLAGWINLRCNLNKIIKHSEGKPLVMLKLLSHLELNL